jgi:hypothetical protein
MAARKAKRRKKRRPYDKEAEDRMWRALGMPTAAEVDAAEHMRADAGGKRARDAMALRRRIARGR